MGPFEAIEKLINEHGSATILREHVNLLREREQGLERRVTQLEEENATLKRRITELEEDAAHALVAGDFVERRGALFKRKLEGGYHEAVYCPRCQGPMMSLQGMLRAIASKSPGRAPGVGNPAPWPPGGVSPWLRSGTYSPAGGGSGPAF